MFNFWHRWPTRNYDFNYYVPGRNEMWLINPHSLLRMSLTGLEIFLWVQGVRNIFSHFSSWTSCYLFRRTSKRPGNFLLPSQNGHGGKGKKSSIFGNRGNPSTRKRLLSHCQWIHSKSPAKWRTDHLVPVNHITRTPILSAHPIYQHICTLY